MRRLARPWALAALLVVGQWPAPWTDVDVRFARVAFADSPLEETPQRSAFFGDLHIHTMYSHDAFLASELNTPDDAYRYAKGEPRP